MGNPVTPPKKEEIQVIWERVIKDGDNASLTFHELPAASVDDVAKLVDRIVLSSSKSLQVPHGGLPGTKTMAVEPPPGTKTMAVEPPPGALDQPGSASTSRMFPNTKLAGATSLDAGGGKVISVRGAMFTEEELKGQNAVLSQDIFSLGEPLGKGGMGIVYLAKQGSLDRDVAIKTIKEKGEVTPAQMHAFMQEALMTGALAHPNIVPVHLFGRDEAGRVFLVMKRVDGRPWSDLLHPRKDESGGFNGTDVRSSARELAKHLEIFQKVCDAVSFAHAKRILHRDLKPENVMIGEHGEVVVMDWGLALDLEARDRKGPGQKLTTVAGTPAYMAPEMVMGELNDLQPATDIYLLGAILHEIITGRPPHHGKTVWDVLHHAAVGVLDPIRPRDGMPMEARMLEPILKKALDSAPQKRYATVLELQEDIRNFLANQGNRDESEEFAREGRDELAKLTADSADMRVTSLFYPRCAEVLYKAQQSLTQWAHNPRAMRLRQEALALYARLGIRGKDWGLVESHLLDLKNSGSGGAALAAPIENEMRVQREAWNRKEYLLRRNARAAVYLIMLSVALGLTCGALILRQVYMENPKNSTVELVVPEVLQAKKDPVQDPLKPPQPKPPGPADLPFATELGKPWWVARDAERGSVFKAEDGRKLVGIDIHASNGRMALWDESGGVWIWDGDANKLPSKPGLKPDGKFQAQLVRWMDSDFAVASNARGEFMVGGRFPGDWKTLHNAGEPVQNFLAARSGNEITLAIVGEKNLQYFKLADGAPVGGIAKFPIDASLLAMEWQPSGVYVIVLENKILRADPSGKVETMTMRRPSGAGNELQSYVRAAIATSGGRILLVPADKKNQVNVMNLDIGSGGGAGLFQKGEVSALALSPDGVWGAAGSSTGQMLLIDMNSMHMVTHGKAQDSTVRGLEFSSDGRVLYSVDATGGVHAWDLSMWTKK